MSNEDNPRWSKGRRVAGALTGLVLGGAAFLLPPSVASAATDGPPPLPANAKDIALEYKKIPAGAKAVTRAFPEVGTSGEVFNGRTTVKNGDTRIVGGTVVTNPADHASVVAIRSYFVAWDASGTAGWYYSTCTGTVLSPTKVLTAAHCTLDLPFGTTYVIAGRTDVRESIGGGTGGQVSRVASTWTHQQYNFAAQYEAFENGTTVPAPLNDVSVLTLKDPLNAAYTPVTLAPQSAESAAEIADGTNSTIVGFGVAEPDSSDEAGILRVAQVPVQQDSDCSSTYGSQFNADAMMCAGDPAGGKDTCHGDSGGPIFVDGVQVGVTSWGYDPCASSYGVYARVGQYTDLINADKARSGLVNLDWSGDGHSDFIVRCNVQTPGWLCGASGNLIMVSGAGVVTTQNNEYGYEKYSINGYARIGTGFQKYTKIMRVTGWNNDGKPSLIMRDSAGGLFQYKSDGEGNFVGSAIKIGSGWNMFNDIVVTNNWMGDGMPNLMGRKSNGELWIYTSNGAGGWKNPSGTKIGTGWGMFNTILTPGSWMGNGYQTLLGRKPDGTLWMYNSNGSGGWSNPAGTKIGSGWSMFKVFMSPGDWNGDDMIDLVGVKPDGTVRLYTTNGKGAWIDGSGRVIDIDWDLFNSVF